MYCNKCGNEEEFRINRTQRTVACRNPSCNNIIRNKNNFDYRGVDEVNWFSHHMLQKLNTPKNQVKPDWDCTSVEVLLMRLRDELKELEIEYSRQRKAGTSDNNAILSECCDVANFAMMIADNLCTTKHRAYLGD